MNLGTDNITEQKVILVVEDNDAIRENTVEILELYDFNIIQALNGKQGYELARDHRVDLILCDVSMPEMDGFELLEKLNKDNGKDGIPFIFFSAKVEPYEIKKGLDLGAVNYIKKPFREDELVHAVKSAFKAKE